LGLQLACLHVLAAAAWRLETLVASVSLATAYVLGTVLIGKGAPFALWCAAAIALWLARRYATDAPAAHWRWLAAGLLILLPAAGVMGLVLTDATSRALNFGPLSSASVFPLLAVVWSLVLLGPGWVALRTLEEARTLPARL
jgi:hypothetical protein